MRTSWRRLRRSAGAEDGWSLVELIVVCAISIVVIGVPLTLMLQAVIGQNRASSRSAATNRVEVGVSSLMHDLRSAVSTTTVSSSTSATLTVPVRSAAGGVTPATQQVTWTCTGGGATGSCTRRVGAGTALKVIPYVVSATFVPESATGATTVPSTDPAYVTFTVSVLNSSEQGDRTSTVSSFPITVKDGVALRNFAL